MASVRKLKKKNGAVFYQALWSVRDLDGTRRQPSKSFATMKEAKAFAAQMAKEVEGAGVHDRRYTLGEYLKYWVDWVDRTGQKSPTTIDFYRRSCDHVVEFAGRIELRKLDARILDQAYAELLERGGWSHKPGKDGAPRQRVALAARTVHHCHRVISNALKQARKWKLVGENVATDASPPSPQKSKARSMSDEEASRVWHAALKTQTRAKGYPGLDAAVMLLLTCGIRRSELLGLCWDAVDLDVATIEVRQTLIQSNAGVELRAATKTKSSARPISLPLAVVERLRQHKAMIMRQALAYGRDYLRDPFFVFPEHGGAMPNPRTWTGRLRSIMNSAGVKRIQPCHGWRHTMATSMIRNGVDLKTVSTRLGHSTTAITNDLYVHPEDVRDRAAAEVIGTHFEALTRG
ncbi:tyrosine-type recombinase/integrase [Mesorhizobium kowhaii]|nr:tyrosine-type recombinase/integrase [Mesorhizobium kowhaii]